jgi:hypothetical protein
MLRTTWMAAVAMTVLASAGAKAGEPMGTPVLSKPFTHENLTIYLVRGQESTAGKKFLTLPEALEQKKIVIHETQNVNQLAVENVSDDEVFIHAGDIVKGGQQDRVLGCDLIVSAKSGRVPLPSFCVERGRWQKRGNEDVSKFEKCDNLAYSNALRLAVLQARDQQEVWAKVREDQKKLGEKAGISVQSAESPTSLQLTLENKRVQETVDKYSAELGKAIASEKDAIGCVVVINGRIENADVYASPGLFGKIFPRLLKGASAAAFAELSKDAKWEPTTAAAVNSFLTEGKSTKVNSQEVTKRIQIKIVEKEKNVIVETCDRDQKGDVIHRSYVAR